MRREVVLTTDVERQALDVEVQLIQEHRTFVDGGTGWWGANLTLGGEGVSGTHINKGRTFSAEHRQKLSQARRGRAPWNKGQQNVYTDEALAKIKKARSRQVTSTETKQKIADGVRRSWSKRCD